MVDITKINGDFFVSFFFLLIRAGGEIWKGKEKVGGVKRVEEERAFGAWRSTGVVVLGAFGGLGDTRQGTKAGTRWEEEEL